jgi:hypothetical protein
MSDVETEVFALQKLHLKQINSAIHGAEDEE